MPTDAKTLLHEDRLFPADPTQRAIARRLYAETRELPIVSPHGHTQAAWFAQNEPFPDPATLFVQPDHYVYRMLYSQGFSLDDLEIGVDVLKDPRRVWRIFAEHYYLFRGTPTRMWLDYAFQELFGLNERLCGETADLYFDVIAEPQDHLQAGMQRAGARGGFIGEVRARDVADQQRIPAEDHPGLGAAGAIGDRKGQMLGAMAGRRQRA